MLLENHTQNSKSDILFKYLVLFETETKSTSEEFNRIRVILVM